MSLANPRWGAPRIHGELLKIGIEVSPGRLIGSIRRECLDHVIVFHEAGLRRILRDYFAYYERCRTHLSLDRVHRSIDPSSRPRLATSSKFQESAVCIIFIRAKRPDREDFQTFA
jgi:hypothetical protein